MRVARRQFLTATGTVLGASVGTMASRPDAHAQPADDRSERLFELGTVTYNIGRDWDLETLISKCEQLNLKAVELRSTHKHGVEPDISREARQEVRRRFADTPVVLFGLGSACEFHSPDKEVVKRNVELTGKFIQLAHDVGARGVKVRPNGLATKQRIPVETTLKQIAHALQECGEIADRFGVEIWVEVHGRGTSHPPHMRTILDACGHPAIGVTWNCNPTDLKDGSIREYFDLLKADIRCVHIHDLWNDYPYRELFGLLRGIGYDRYTLTEMAGSPDADRLLRYYRMLWEELSRPGRV